MFYVNYIQNIKTFVDDSTSKFSDVKFIPLSCIFDGGL